LSPTSIVVEVPTFCLSAILFSVMNPFQVTLPLTPLKSKPAVSQSSRSRMRGAGHRHALGPPNFPFAPHFAFPTERAGLPLWTPLLTPTSAN
jgi:hypothetical protein